MAHQLLNWKNRLCSFRCRSRQHSCLMSTALSKAPCEQFQAFCVLTCRNFWRQTDSGGRTLVHWSASRGKEDVLEWLITQLRADISSKDLESGYTPLHRSLLHGQISCAQILIDYGASTNSLDHEGLTPLDLVRKDQNTGGYSVREPVELYSCGENMSYNLGHAHPTPRVTPEPVDYFRRHAISIRKVSMSKFHTIFLSLSGQVYACGHGLGGRLGLGCEEPQFHPKLISSLKEATVVDVAAATDHSLFVDQSGNAYSCGMNSWKQLGLGSSVEKVLEPESIKMAKTFKAKFAGCAAGSYHSILWTDDWSLYTFGLNAGQLGHSKTDGEFISLPKKVAGFGPGSNAGVTEQERRIFVSVASSDGAVIIATGFESTNKTEANTAVKKGGETWILYKFDKLRIASRQLETKSVYAVGGSLEQKVCSELKDPNISDPLRILVLTKSGKVFHWHEEDQTLRRCFFFGSKQIYPEDIAVNKKGILAILGDGRAFRGTFGPLRKGGTPGTDRQLLKEYAVQKEKRSKEVSGQLSWRAKNLDEFLTFLDQNECQGITINRLPAVHRGIATFCDSTGKNLMVIQQIPSRDLTEVPVVRPGEISTDMEKLLSEADLADSIHDLEIICRTRKYPVHRFVIQSRAPAMLEAMKEAVEGSVDEKIDWKLPVWCEDMNPCILEEFLKFLYIDDCALLQAGTRWGENGLLLKQPMREQNTEDMVKKKNKKNRQKAQKGTQQKSKEGGGKNPLRQLQELGRKFGVNSLVKKLECLQWEPAEDTTEYSGTVRETKHRSVGIPKLRFDIGSQIESCDVRLNCQDGVQLKAHKCLLVARMEYFRCMLGREWVEATRQRGTAKEPVILSMPFASDVVRLVVYYVYTDELRPSVRQKTDTEVPDLLCRLVICADQLLVERLRELCEASIAECISLRNAPELLQFAQTYNACELKNACLQFVCLNLSSFFDSNGLQLIDRDCLRAIGSYYRRMYSHVGSRMLTPLSGEPSVEEIQMAYSKVLSANVTMQDLTAFLLNEQQTDSGVSPKVLPVKKKIHQQQVTARQRKDAEKAVAGLSGQFSLPSSPSPSPPSRSLEPERRISPRSESAWNSLNPATPDGKILLRQMMEEEKHSGGAKEEKDPLETYFSRRRKEISSDSGSEKPRKFVAWCETPASEEERSPDDGIVSLADVMAEQSEQQKRIVLNEQLRQTPPVQKLTLETVKREKKSPWGGAGEKATVYPFPTESTKKEEDSVRKKKNGTNKSFKAIVAEEEWMLAEKEKRERKPLFAIQMEEQAMQELLFAYEAQQNFDVSISVERVSTLQVAEPIWEAHV